MNQADLLLELLRELDQIPGHKVLPLPPESELQSIKAQELILRFGRGRKVVVIGHFPFVQNIRDQFSDFRILEKSPRPGDIHAEQAPRVLPGADVVAISATTLANGTLAEILEVCSPSARKIMLGPSTPMSPALFRFGIDTLAGSIVMDSVLAKQGNLTGLSFKELEGVRYVVWEKRAGD